MGLKHKRRIWTEEAILAECLKYSSKVELQKNDSSLFQVVWKRGLQSLAFAHMVRPTAWNKKWTSDSIVEACKQYKTLKELIKANRSLYQTVRTRGLCGIAFAHMHRLCRDFKSQNDQQIIEACRGFATRSSLQNGDGGLYRMVCKRNLQTQAFAHMSTRYHPKWTDQEVVRKCREYPTQASLRKECSSVNTIARRMGIQSEAFAHMEKLAGESQDEKDLSSFILSQGLEIQRGHWLIDGKTRRQLDIYIPSRNLAIEYCGLYWHNEDSKEPRLRTYHYDKMKLAEANGIRLITIFEDEWLNRQNQVKNFLSSVLGLSTVRIAARKCVLKGVSKETGKAFFEQYHIQGPARLSFVYFGLYYQDELVGVISGGRHHRQGHADTLVLDRLCFRSGVTVQGGASRLFKKLTEYARANRYDQILSWSDNRWSQGNVYRKLGFVLDQELGPDYCYVKNNVLKRFSKQSLKKKGAERTGDKTERELRKDQGFSRIWDCGKKRWSLNLKDEALTSTKTP